MRSLKLKGWQIDSDGSMTSSDQILKDIAACGADLQIYNLVRPDHQCGPNCAQTVQRWANNFRSYGANDPTNKHVISEHIIKVSDESVSLIRFKHSLSNLRLPSSVDLYMQTIGGKSRNIMRKAEKLGYEHHHADSRALLDDIFAIRTSSPCRQGKPIPDYFKEYPLKPISTEGLCERHNEEFFGVFLKEKLVAYCTLRFFGEIAQINHILGHKDHVQNGIMYLLMYGIVRWLTAHKPWLRAINYLYASDIHGGLGQFKYNLGFKPEQALTVIASIPAGKAVCDIVIDRSDRPLRVTKPSAVAAPRHKSGVFALEEGLVFQGSMVPPRDAKMGTALESAIKAVGPAATASVVHLSWDGEGNSSRELWKIMQGRLERGNLGEFPSIGADLAVADVPMEATVRTLSRDLARLAKWLKPLGTLVVPIIWDYERLRSESATHPKIPSEREFLRRFGNFCHDVATLARAFRGSDFQLRGVIDISNGDGPLQGIGWGILSKISKSGNGLLDEPDELRVTARLMAVSDEREGNPSSTLPNSADAQTDCQRLCLDRQQLAERSRGEGVEEKSEPIHKEIEKIEADVRKGPSLGGTIDRSSLKTPSSGEGIYLPLVPQVSDHNNLGFRAIIKALPIKMGCRALDVGAGGFVGQSTTVHLLELLAAQIDAVELSKERAEKLLERFGNKLQVWAQDIFTFNWPLGKYDLIVMDLDSAVIPLMMENLVPIAKDHLAQSGYMILVTIYDAEEVYNAENPLLPVGGRDKQIEFMNRYYGTPKLAVETARRVFEGSNLTVVGIVDKYMGTSRRCVGWLVLQKKDELSQV